MDNLLENVLLERKLLPGMDFQAERYNKGNSSRKRMSNKIC